MLSSSEEYERMYITEEQLWWYRILHEKVLKTIRNHHQHNYNIKILDAGCGTGGLLNILRNKNYQNIEGFDFSIDAVNFCNERNLNVKQIDITNFDTEFENDSYDVIINNDVMYQFDDSEIYKILINLERKLKAGGIIITNNQAFRVFNGTHDIAVGAKRRFTISDFRRLISLNPNLSLKDYTYWSLFLSPLILLIRVFQQVKLKFNLISVSEIKSDVDLPSPWVNKLLYSIVKLEEKLLSKNFFGSSLFLILSKK